MHLFNLVKMPVVLRLYYACVFCEHVCGCMCMYARISFPRVHICVHLFVYQSVLVFNVMIVLSVSQIPHSKESEICCLTTYCEAVTCLQHLISAQWFLRYQMAESMQQPCSSLFSIVLACI